MCTRGVFISIEGSPSSVDTKFAILEAYLTSIGLSYHTFFPNDDSTLGSILFDIEHSMFTEYTPEAIFLLQCAFFNQHAHRIEELLYRWKIVIAFCHNNNLLFVYKYIYHKFSKQKKGKCLNSPLIYCVLVIRILRLRSRKSK